MSKYYDLKCRVDDLYEFLRWPSIDSKNTNFKDWIENIADNRANKAIDNLNLGCEVEREEFNLLLDYLGVEIEDGLRIVKKKKGKK